MAHDVFISHSSQDKPVADAVCAALETAEIRCWLAPRDVQPGRSFAGEITRAIQRSKVMVLIFSAHSNTSEQVLREVQLAANSHLHIIQFRIQDVLPNDDLEYYLSTPHWLDALTPPLERHLDRLERSIKALLELAQGDSSATPVTAVAKEAATQSAAKNYAAPPIIPVMPSIPPDPAPTFAETPLAPRPAIPSISGHVPPTSPVPSIEPPLAKQTRPIRLPMPPLPWLVAAILALLLVVVVIGFVFKSRKGGAPVRIAENPSPAPIASSTTEPAKAQPSATAEKKTRYSGAPDAGRNLTFAFVDMDRVFKEYGKKKDAEATINEAKNVAKREFDDRANVYKERLDEINNLNKKLNSSTLGGDIKTQLVLDRDDKVAAIKDLEREINKFRDDREKQLQDQALRLRTTLVDEITLRINDLGFLTNNLILDRSGNSLNGVPIVLFAPTKADMSNSVISVLNNGKARAFTGAQGISVALVDMNRVFKNYSKTKTSESKVNEAKAAAKSEFDSRADIYKQKLNEIGAMPAGRERDSAIADVKVIERETNDFRKAREKELQDQALRLRAEIVSEITTFIDQKYVKDRACMIIDSSGTTLSGVPWVMFASGVPDLSDGVIAGLNGTRTSAETSTFVSSEKLRLAHVDMRRALNALPETKMVEAEIKAASDKAYADLGAHPDASARAAKDKEVTALAASKRQPSASKITTEAAALGRKYSFNLIYNQEGRSVNNVPIIISSREVPDLTAEVITDLGGSQ